MDKSILDIRTPDNSADCFLVALLQLMKTKHYDNISVTDICKECHLSRKTFYDNFTCKDDLLQHLIKDFCTGYTQTDNHDGYYQYFEFWYHLQDWVTVLIKNNLWYEVNRKLLALGVDSIRPRNWNTILGSHLNQKSLIFEFINSGLARVVELWCESNFELSPSELADMTEYILTENFNKKC